jgi:hypothetical protein
MEVMAAKATAYAPSTVKNLRSQWKGYLLFCVHAEVSPVPISSRDLCCYLVFLARSIKAYQTVKNYLNAVRLFHLCRGVPFDLLDNFELKLVLRSLKGRLTTVSKPKLPITVDILLQIHRHLDMEVSSHTVLWAAFLIGFFAFLRKSNIVPESTRLFDPEKHLTRQSIRITDYGIQVTVKWSKTIQFHEREVILPLIAIPNSVLCPKRAYINMCQHIPAEPNAPAFSLPNRGTLTHQSFVKLLRALLAKCNIDPTKYSGHSFRRGACTMAFEAGVSPELIRSHGDWRSNAYLRYLHFDLGHKLTVTTLMSNRIMTFQ